MSEVKKTVKKTTRFAAHLVRTVKPGGQSQIFHPMEYNAKKANAGELGDYKNAAFVSVR